MIIEFSVANYCSFDEIQTLNFRATALDSADSDVDRKNIVFMESNRILKIIGTYGANASGKTNFVKALSFFKQMVSNSVQTEGLSNIGVNPFRQAIKDTDKPSYFQIVLLLNQKRYRYGFTLDNSGSISSEWLFGPADKNETFYFKRNNKEILVNKEWFDEGATLPEENLRTDALFLSFCSSYNGAISKLIRSFFFKNVTIDAKLPKRGIRIDVIGGPGAFGQTNRLVENGSEEMILTWLKEVGLIYNGIKVENNEGPAFQNSIVYLSKNIYDNSGKVIGQAVMDLNADESEGTKKFYGYIGKLYRKFQEGGVYVCDEIDSNFHPSLLQKIIQLFQNSNVNKANAQLLFTSHDTNLMDPEIMRRDQFYFAEKNIYDATKLYSLADLKGIRNNADFARQYLAGIYGALPILGNFLEEEQEKPNEQL